MHELSQTELVKVAGGFGFNDDPPPPPEQEDDQSTVEDHTNPWWDENDNITIGAAIGGLIGGLTTRSNTGAAVGAAVGGYVGNRVGDIPPGEPTCPGVGIDNPCGPVAIR